MFTRLQKLGVSLSHRATIDLIDEMGIGHDEAELNWRDRSDLLTLTFRRLRDDTLLISLFIRLQN